MLHYYWEQLLSWLQKHPMIGFITAPVGSILAYKEYVGTVLSWVGAAALIIVSLLTARAKHLENRERKLNIKLLEEKLKEEQRKNKQ